MSLERARQTGNFYMPTNPFEGATENMKQDKKAEELSKKLTEAYEAKQKEIEDRLEDLEIVPNMNKVIIMPYPTNPYRKFMTESGIILENTGMFLNPDTGEMDKMEEIVYCGKVIEVGPECKTVVPGDDVYYDKRTVYPLPFMSLGYKLTSEPQILAIINNKVKERLGYGK